MKKSVSKIAVALAALLSSAVVHAGTTFEPVEYATFGLWVNAPLGASARLGLAIPTGDETAITMGNEFGLYGNKQFVGYRMGSKNYGILMASIDVARWKTRSHAWLADKQTEYYGVEAQLILLRAGLMFPKGGGHHPTVTLGIGAGF